MSARRSILIALFALVWAAPIWAQPRAGVIEYYHVDALGSVRAVTNASGGTVRTHHYHPFGEGVGVEATTDPMRFTGKPRDGETGLDYCGARYFAPRIGRFTTVDPILLVDRSIADPQSWNRYSYTKNNPLRYVDPDGRIWETLWDVGNVVYSGYKCLTGSGCGDLAWDAAATMVPFVPAGASRVFGGADDALEVARGAKLLSTISASTIDVAVATGAEAAGRQGTVAFRALASHIDRGDSAFRGVAKTPESALGLIRSILSDPSRVAAGQQTVDVYNAAGQGVKT
jgi:RHS repeat-associated protein